MLKPEVVIMENQNYMPRIIDTRIEEYLKAFGAVCVEGPRGCGKTWTSAYHSGSEFLMDIVLSLQQCDLHWRPHR